MKPVINMDELEYHEHEHGRFHAKFAPVSDGIGAKELGYNVSVVPSGKTVCPFHNHQNAEEMFFVLEGVGQLRFGEEKYPLRKGDFIACPAGGRDVAHQILNTGDADLIYIALSTMPKADVCEYPDSNKMGVYVGENRRKRDIRHLCKMEDAVDYYEGEK